MRTELYYEQQLPGEFWHLRGMCGYFLLSVSKVSTNRMVKVEFVGQRLCMTEGFEDFFNYFKIVKGSQIRMEYGGKRIFLVKIDSYDGVEIDYDKYSVYSSSTNNIGFAGKISVSS